MSERVDLAIIGGGIVGLATAYRVLERRPGLSVVLVEKESGLARHQSGHNSGVVHAGLYYAAGSRKAALCREGKAQLEAFCDGHGIPIDRCGKLVVAVSRAELPGLEAIAVRAEANEVPGLERVRPERMAEVEPHVTGVAGLLSPTTAVVDFARVCDALAGEVRARGGVVLLDWSVESIQRWTVGAGREFVLVGPAGELRARSVVSCAGLWSDRVAAMTGDEGTQRIVPFRGDYLRLRPQAAHLVRGLIYPVSDPAFPFLGIHLTRRIDGEVWAGPNAVLATARDGYARTDVSPSDLVDVLGYRGFLRLAARYWRSGAAEMWRDVSRPAFVASVRRYVPELRESDFVDGPSGVRAQSVRIDGTLVDDFSITGGEGILHVRNAPSPAATASLAIGRVLAEVAERRFGL